MWKSVNGGSKVACRDIYNAVHLLDESSLIRRRSVYGIIQSEEGVLLVREDASGDRWDLPGGGVEGQEHDLEALAREIDEETGLSLVGELRKVCGLLECFYDIVTGCAWESERWYFIVESREQKFSDRIGDLLEMKYALPPFLDMPVPLTTRGIIDAFRKS